MTITGIRMDEYPVLGAHFISDDDLPELFGYAVPRFFGGVFNDYNVLGNGYRFIDILPCIS